MELKYPGSVKKEGDVGVYHLTVHQGVDPNGEKIFGGTNVSSKGGTAVVEVEENGKKNPQIFTIRKFGSLTFPEDKGDSLVVSDGIVQIFKRVADRTLSIVVGAYEASIKGTSFVVEVNGPRDVEISVIDGLATIDLSTNKLTYGGPLDSAPADSVIPVGALQKIKIKDDVVTGPTRVEVVGAQLRWFMYYPPIVSFPVSLEFGDASLNKSLQEYRAGDLGGAYAHFLDFEKKEGAGNLTTDPHWVSKLAATLMLSFGRYGEAIDRILALPCGDPERDALVFLVDFVRGDKLADENCESIYPFQPSSGSEWLAYSYAQQKDGDLDAAVASALTAIELYPEAGFPRFRYAELLSYQGLREQATIALEDALELSGELPQAIALKSILSGVKNAGVSLDRLEAAAIAAPNNPDVWIAKGLLEFASASDANGRNRGVSDLLKAASNAPNETVPRIYLSEAWRRIGEIGLAVKELNAVIELDPRDPVGYFYRSLTNRDSNSVNSAILDLRDSIARNENRSLFRSERLLRLDNSVWQSNIASIFEEAGLEEWALRESSLAVTDSYGSVGAHLFLANSFDALRDQDRLLLRFDTAWRSEQLLANLLAPFGSEVLPQHASLREYSPLLRRSKYGANLEFSYRSDSLKQTRGSFYGDLGSRLSYSYDFEDRRFDGLFEGEGSQSTEHNARLRYERNYNETYFLQLNDIDSIVENDLVLGGGSEARFIGTIDENSGPNALFGYSRTFNDSGRVLLIAGQQDTSYLADGTVPSTRFITNQGGEPIQLFDLAIPMNRRLATEIDVRFLELQRIFESNYHEAILGARVQDGEFRTSEALDLWDDTFSGFFESDPVSRQSAIASMSRKEAYGYYSWKWNSQVKPTIGFNYAEMEYPVNFRQPPILSGNKKDRRLSPKLGLVYRFEDELSIQAIYSQSFGGVSLDESYQLEPTQIAGLQQTFRSLLPESVFGSVAGQRHEISGVSTIYSPSRRLRIALDVFDRRSISDESFGLFTRFAPEFFARPTQEEVELAFRESEYVLAIQYLLRDRWTLSVSSDWVKRRARWDYINVPSDVSELSRQQFGSDSWFNRFNLTYNLPTGFYVDLATSLVGHSDRSVAVNLGEGSALINDIRIGYRSENQRYELEAGLLNIGDEPLVLSQLADSPDFPGERAIQLKVNLNL